MPQGGFYRTTCVRKTRVAGSDLRSEAAPSRVPAQNAESQLLEIQL